MLTFKLIDYAQLSCFGQHLLPGKASDHGRSGHDNRLFVEATYMLARSGAPLRDLPAEFGNWNNVYQSFARWQKHGVWSECSRS